MWVVESERCREISRPRATNAGKSSAFSLYREAEKHPWTRRAFVSEHSLHPRAEFLLGE